MSGLRIMHHHHHYQYSLLRLKSLHRPLFSSPLVWSPAVLTHHLPSPPQQQQQQQRAFQFSHRHNHHHHHHHHHHATHGRGTKSALHVLLRSSPLSSSFGGKTNAIMQRCCFSTDSSISANNKAAVSIISQNKLVLGSHKWSSMDPLQYCEIVHTALANGITTIEAGQGPGALNALHTCLSQKMQLQPATIRILQRVGYRTKLRLPPPPPPPSPNDDDEELDNTEKQPQSTTTATTTTTSPTPAPPTTADATDKQDATASFSLLPGDVIVEEVPVSAEEAAVPVPGAPQPRCSTSKQSTSAATNNIPAGSTTVVLHNTSAAGIQEAMSTSPFIMTTATTTTTPLSTLDSNPKVETVLMLHNPEVQGQDGSSSSSSTTRNSGGLILPTTTTSSSSKARQDIICAQLVESFGALEKAVQNGQIASYGIVSNGLGLPYDHPLHLSWQGAIRPALELAFQNLNEINNNNNNTNDSTAAAPPRKLLHFSILELPVNLIETTGLQVARQVQKDLQQNDDFRKIFAAKSKIEIYAMRPLSAYPDLGTGQDGHSLVLADYLLPTLTSMNEVAGGGGAVETTMTSSDSDLKPPPPPPPRMQWSHTMASPPEIYNVALQSAIAHFDAEAILEAQQERLAQGEKADLTAEERETLDGCKLMQSLLHDVDVGLQKMRCFAVHERELMQRIIPLIYDTFEEYDDDTAKVLQTFFAAYSLAVRYAIAKNTRHLLLHGEDSSLASSASSNIPIFKDLHPDMKLQEYAIEFILKQQLETLQEEQQETTNDSDNVASSDGAGKAAQSKASSKDVIDKIVVGCNDPDQIIDDLELVYQFYARKKQEEKAAATVAETQV